MLYKVWHMPHFLKLEKTNEGSTRYGICPTPLKLGKQKLITP